MLQAAANTDTITQFRNSTSNQDGAFKKEVTPW
jgi:hypothetical protein